MKQKRPSGKLYVDVYRKHSKYPYCRSSDYTLSRGEVADSTLENLAIRWVPGDWENGDRIIAGCWSMAGDLIDSEKAFRIVGWTGGYNHCGVCEPRLTAIE